MKILSLKAQNINSLKGKIAIDFETLTKKSALFAIVGPTGSGKSTILDIISCALYGRTVRLKNPNDLISRHAGEAYCEVEFEVKGKRYRSSWAQRRAHKKHDGAFQSAKMELVDMTADKIFPLKPREVPKKVEDICGLDFGRFTQSMLLAQGGFDAFLRADEKERSALLEKITGTQIYATISQKVFEKFRFYEQEFTKQKASIDAIELLSEEDIDMMERALNEALVQKEATQKNLETIMSSLVWIARYDELQEEYKKYSDAFNAAQKQKEQHKESFTKLHLANQAFALLPQATKLLELQKNIEEGSQRLKNLSDELRDLREAIEEKSENYTKLQERFITETQSYEKEQNKLKEARKIATKQESLAMQIQDNEHNSAKKQKELESLTEVLHQIESDYAKLVEKSAMLNEYFFKHEKDKKLLSHIELLAQNITTYKERSKTYQDIERLFKKLEQEYKAQQNQFQRQTAKLSDLERTLQRDESAYEEHEAQMQKDLIDEEPLSKNLTKLQKLLERVDLYEVDAEEEHQKREAYRHLKSRVASLKEMISMKYELLKKIKEQIGLLREKESYEQLVQKYEADRAKLKEGEACFLCGATKHPFVKNKPESFMSNTKSLREKEESHLEQEEQALRELEKELSASQTELLVLERDRELLQERMLHTEKIFSDSGEKLHTKSKEELLQKQEKLKRDFKEIKENRLKKETLLQVRELARQAYQKESKALQESKSTLEKQEQKLQQYKMTLEENRSKIEELEEYFKEELGNFGEELEIENLDILYTKLLKRKESYLQKTQELALVEKEFTHCSIKKQESVTAQELLQKEYRLLMQKINQEKLQYQALQEQKIALLNVADLDLYEQEIISAYKVLQKQVSKTALLLNELRVEAKEKGEAKEQLEENLKKTQANELQLKELFEVGLSERGFSDKEAFEQALLDEGEKEELERFSLAIEQEYKEMQTLQQQSKESLQEHEKKRVTDRSEKELKSIKSLEQQKLDALQESIGSIKKELTINAAKVEELGVKIAALKEAKSHLDVWIKLNELIGSADGAKFKKFAQGVTLDQLVYLANEHLKSLSDRYRLSRNEEKLLELDVVDAYQGNVVRSVTTLSGGESFIVSLALALGLSELASQKISIDSLFLDEGFGTLDAQSLESALNALNLLQSSGKMVGVISHVEALKERIPLQIRVTPRGDGTSFLDIVD